MDEAVHDSIQDVSDTVSSDAQALAVGVHSDADQVGPTEDLTGFAPVDRIMAETRQLEGLAPADRVAVFERVHEGLRRSLDSQPHDEMKGN